MVVLGVKQKRRFTVLRESNSSCLFEKWS